jgi:hypothetical protein
MNDEISPKVIIVRNEREFRRIGLVTLSKADFVAVRVEEGYKIVKDRFGSNNTTVLVTPINTFFHTLNNFVGQNGFTDIYAINERSREIANMNRRIWREQYDRAIWLKKNNSNDDVDWVKEGF